MYEKLTECPVCSSDNIANQLVVKDHTVSQESFVIMECKNCQFQFTNPRPSLEHIGSFYESDDYISHTNKGNSLINIIYKLVRIRSTKNKIKLVQNINKQKKGRILDFGSGTGYFINSIKKKGWKIAAVEPDKNARMIASTLTGENVFSNLDEVVKHGDKYDIITLWHVLEHVHDLNNVFIQLKGLLKEKGKMIIAVPNIDSYDNSHYKEHWAAYDVPRHLYHFNQDSMKTFVMKHGMKIKKIYPMPFDAYYISMLSEKYSKGGSNMIKSLLNGYKSNSYASNNKNNSSSIIFQIKK